MGDLLRCVTIEEAKLKNRPVLRADALQQHGVFDFLNSPVFQVPRQIVLRIFIFQNCPAVAIKEQVFERAEQSCPPLAAGLGIAKAF